MIHEMLKQRFPDKNVINYANVSDLYYDWAEHLNGFSPKDRPGFIDNSPAKLGSLPDFQCQPPAKLDSLPE